MNTVFPRAAASLLAVAACALPPQAQARNDKLLLPLAHVMRQQSTRDLLGNLPVRFGGASAAGADIVSQQVEAHGRVDPYGTTPSGVRRPMPDDEACRAAFRKAIAELALKARNAGGTALVGVVSYYDHVEMDSPDVYECHVGRTRALVDLKAKVARGALPPVAAASAVAARPAAAASAAPATPAAAAAAPAEHVHALPPASGFAQASELDKLPLQRKGRERYQHYLTLPPPKAFVVYEDGGWRFQYHDGEAMSKALDFCAREGKRCWLYAVDDRVVWDADPARRIGSTSQLRPKDAR